MAQKIFLNKEIIDEDKACIAANDAGFLYGAGIFETMRAANGKVFALEDHLDRLFFSINQLKIGISLVRADVEAAIFKTLEANGLSDARIRLTVTNGPMSISEEPEPTLLITALPFQPYPEDYYETGVKVALTDTRRSSSDPIARFKTTNYMPNLLALNTARLKGAVEALWFTTDGELAEGCISNVFIIKDGVVITPPLETPILQGIAREQIGRLLIKNNIKYEEKRIHINTLLEAEEMFISNVVMQVLPVNSVEKHVVNDGKPGKMTKKIGKIFTEYFNEYCGI